MSFQMKLQWSRTRALLIAVALVVFTNAVVLAGVAYNRGGEPEAVLQLTERELRLYNWSWPENENSSVDLHLGWRVASPPGANRSYANGTLDWLTPAQLQELGFDISGNMRSDEDVQRATRQPSRRAWLVLEHDGPDYQAALEAARIRLERATSLARANAGDEEFEKRLKRAQEEFTREEQYDSRLFVVDVSIDPDALRKRYPDRRQYAVVQGRVGISVRGPDGRERPVLRVHDIDVDAIRVPYEYREIVEPLIRNADTHYYRREPRFAATVNFGQRYEPWIVDLQPLQPSQP